MNIATSSCGAMPFSYCALRELGLAFVAGGVIKPSNFSVSHIILVVLSELLIGAAIATTLIAGFSIFHIGGRLLDFQIGYGISGLYDLTTRNNMPLLGSLLSMTAVLLFFILDGHLALIKMV